MKSFILWLGGALDIAFTFYLMIGVIKYIVIEPNEIYMFGYAAVLALWCISCSIGKIRECLEQPRG